MSDGAAAGSGTGGGEAEVTDGVRLIPGNCLEIMPTIEPGSVDLILADLPYGSTRCSWDTIIPFEPLWAAYKRLLKPLGAVVLTATQPFASMLVMSNISWFRYDWVWDRCGKISGHLDAQRRPLRRHELILVFSSGQTTYNPIKTMGQTVKATSSKPDVVGSIYNTAKRIPYCSSERFPVDILAIPAPDSRQRVHPTQKPVALGSYLIRTYSNPGDLVMDNATGSGSFGVAAVQEGRRFLGMELRPDYFAIAQRRIAAAQTDIKSRLFA